MANKWIVNNGQFLMSASVEFHKELAEDHSTTKGGGMWAIDEANKTLYLWGVSSDFGYCEPEDAKFAIMSRMSPRFDGYRIMKSPIICQTIPNLDSFTLIHTIKEQNQTKTHENTNT